MLHLASNNLLSEGQASDVMDSLLQSGSRSLFNALISPQSPATKAIARSLLSSAIKSMDVPMVRSLLDTGISPDSPTSYSQERPLKLAVRVGCMEVARLLLHYGAQVNLPCFKGSSLPLTIAANDGALKLVQLLLGAGADVNAPGGHGIRKMTALQIAAAANRSDIVQLLLGAGANINAPALGDSGQTALQAASRTENIALVELLLSHGADVNAPVSHFEGRTALQAAAQTGNTSLVELLLSHGADVNALGTRGTRTALQWAASAGDVGLVQLLLEWGALDILDAMGLAFVQSHIQILQTLLRFGQTLGPLSSGAYERMALKAGARCGDYRFVRQLLESRTEVDAPAIENDTKWTTGLQEAARRGHKDIAQLLITFGADVNAPARGDGGLTALQGAALKGDVEMVKILLCAGADVNAPTSKFGEVALTMAVKSKSLEIAKLLLASGAHLYEHSLQSALGCESSREIVQLFLDHNLEHDNNLFMVHSFDAIKAGDNELIYLLLEYEALDEARSLTDATYASNFELVEVLLKFGAEVNDNIFFNDEGFALEAAASLGNLKIMNLLLGHGANAREKARALQAAANENQVEAARLLISSTTDVNNAPLNVMDWENGIQASPRTAMQAAAGTGNLELVQLLLGAGADVESKVRHEDEEGTALQFAAISGSISVASFLIEHGADVNAPPIGKYGRSALEGAAEHGRLDMVQLLLNVEAEVRGSRAVQFARNEGHDGVVQLLLENDLKAHG
jgi:ankyrin repeat protein